MQIQKCQRYTEKENWWHSVFKHGTAGLVGSSSGSGILESAEKVCTIMHTICIWYSVFKYLTTDTIGSSSGSGILELAILYYIILPEIYICRSP